MLLNNGSAQIERYNDWKQLMHAALEHGSPTLVSQLLAKGPIDGNCQV